MTALTQRLYRRLPDGMAVFMSAIFLDSLRFKFTNAPETQTIFGKLDAWSTSLGAPGLFAQTGLFSQYVIGAIELLAATLLLAGIHPRLRHWQAGGALAGLLVMAGAVSFHTLTPLGIDPNNDGGGLFVAACVNLSFAVIMVTILRRTELLGVLSRIGAAIGPVSAPAQTQAMGHPVARTA